MENIKLGDRVKVIGKNSNGEVAFIGETHFSNGIWLGIILDDAKGRNNGTVDGTRYFKCPKNHGVFVRICQIEKECADHKGVHNCCSAVSNKTVYPNYLKASSKLKAEKSLCITRTIDIDKEKSYFLNEEEQPSEHPSLQNKSRTLELQRIKEKNGTLITKLKTTEDSLQETQAKYEKAKEEIKKLQNEIDCKKKQIKIQKLNLRLLKMRHSNRFKDVGIHEIPYQNMNQNKSNEPLDWKSNLFEDDQNISDDELDLESIKALTSMQRIVDLEEQNRIMIQGLVELREFLISKCQSRFPDINSPRSPCLSKNKRGHKNSNSECADDIAISKNSSYDSTFEESISQVKDYAEMLSELTKFNEIMKEKEKSGKEQDLKNVNAGSCGCSSTQKEHKSSNNDKITECKQSFVNESSICKKSGLKCSNAKSDIGTYRNALVPKNDNDIQSYFEQANNQGSHQLSTVTPQMKRLSHMHYRGDTIPTKSADPVDELRQLMSNLMPNSYSDPCCSDTSLIQQEFLVEEVPDFTSNSDKSELNSDRQWFFPNTAKELTLKSSGDNAMARPKGKKPKRRMLLSTRIYQRQEL